MQSLQSLVKSCMFSLKDNYFFCCRATRASVQVVKVFVFVNVTMKRCLRMQICPYARWSIREWQFLMCCVFFCLFLHVFVCECVSVSMCFLLIILPPPLLYKINGSVQHAVLSGLLISDTVFPILPLSGLETHTQSHTHTHTHLHKDYCDLLHAFYTILRFLQSTVFATVIIRIYKRAQFSRHPSFSLSSSLSLRLWRSHWLC